MILMSVLCLLVLISLICIHSRITLEVRHSVCKIITLCLSMLVFRALYVEV
jgi:hypothetical protein